MSPNPSYPGLRRDQWEEESNLNAERNLDIEDGGKRSPNERRPSASLWPHLVLMLRAPSPIEQSGLVCTQQGGTVPPAQKANAFL